MSRLRNVALAMLAAAGPGCVTFVPLDQYEAMKAQKQAAQQRAEALQRDNQALQAQVDQQQRQIATLQGLGEKRLEQLYHVARVELGRYSGGVDTDAMPGDDAVRVYLRPIDQHGSELKAPGSVTVRLFDLAAPEGDSLIGECSWSVEEVARQWHSGFVSYHYTLDCPFKKPPRRQEVTVRVEFTDYLTGRTFSAQTTCKVKLPPQARP